MNLITLTTDFGLKDPFVGMMKGVIYNINESADIVDITHEIRSQDILEGAFILSKSYRFFPKGTVHVAVVDPGVGSTRRPILVIASGHYFIGPDNGILFPVIDEDPNSKVIGITQDRYFLRSVSATFHGRDIFAPAAAWLSKGIDPLSFGPLIASFTTLSIPPIERGPGYIRGRVIYIDRFGNVITNIPSSQIDILHQGGISTDRLKTKIGGMEIIGLSRYYGEVKAGEIGVILNSFGLFEIYAYMGRAAEIIHAEKGDIVEIQYQ